MKRQLILGLITLLFTASLHAQHAVDHNVREEGVDSQLWGRV